MVCGGSDAYVSGLIRPYLGKLEKKELIEKGTYDEKDYFNVAGDDATFSSLL